MSNLLRGSLLCLLAVFAWVSVSSRALAQTEQELVFAGFGGTLGQAVKTRLIPPFEKRYGVKVVFLTQETVNMVARLKASAARPEIDVVAGTDASHAAGEKAGVFARLDPGEFSNFPDLYPFAVFPDGIGVMFGIQSLGLEYNAKVFAQHGWDPPSSWFDLWDPKFKGHVVVYNLPSGYAATFLGLLAVLQGGSPADLDPAWAKLPSLVPNAMAFVDPSAQLDMLFSTGGAWLAFNGSGRIAALAASGVPVALATPKEGGVLNPNSLDIVQGAPHPKLASAFVDYMLSPEAQTQIAEGMLFGPVNRKVMLEAPVASKVPYGPDAIARLRQIDNTPINDQLGVLVQRWNALIAKQ